MNTVAISHLRYVPSVSGAEVAVRLASAEMKTARMLSPATDVDGLARRAFVRLEGVSDEWLNSLQVEKVAGGQVTPAWIRRQYAKYNPAEVYCGPCALRRPMNTSLVQIKEPVPIPVETGDREVESSPAIVSKPRGWTLLAVPVATLMALAVHGLVSKNEPSVDPQIYSVFLGLVLGGSWSGRWCNPSGRDCAAG